MWSEEEIKFWDEYDFITQHLADCDTTVQTEETVQTSDTGVDSCHQPEAVQRDHPAIFDETSGATRNDDAIKLANPLVGKEYLAIFEKLSHIICMDTHNIAFANSVTNRSVKELI